MFGRFSDGESHRGDGACQIGRFSDRKNTF